MFRIVYILRSSWVYVMPVSRDIHALDRQADAMERLTHLFFSDLPAAVACWARAIHSLRHGRIVTGGRQSMQAYRRPAKKRLGGFYRCSIA